MTGVLQFNRVFRRCTRERDSCAISASTATAPRSVVVRPQRGLSLFLFLPKYLSSEAAHGEIIARIIVALLAIMSTRHKMREHIQGDKSP